MTNIKTLDDNSLLLDRRETCRMIEFLGVNFAPLTPEQLFERVCNKAKSGEKFGYLVTPNVDHLVRLNKNANYHPLYENAWLNVCDSRIIELFAKFSGFSLPACPGSDLTAQVLESLKDSGETICVIGGDIELIETIKAKYNIAIDWYDAPMGLRNNPDAVTKCAQFMAQSKAGFHFICVGSPQQEMVAMRAAELGQAKGIGLCVGASLEFLSGKVERAPKFMQNLRLEWLHRLLSEPKRMWKRYLIEGPAILLIWHEWRKSNMKTP